MTQPNLLLITIDSLRADAVYEDDVSTPTLDDLQDSGMVFSNAFSQGPFTTFSMPSLFTSRYPSDLGYLKFSDSTVGVYIDDEAVLQAELREQGYETAGFHSNPLISNLFGFDRGFDTFDAHLPFSGTDVLPGRAKILVDKLLRVIRKHPYVPGEALNNRAIEWIDEHRDTRPFFLWLHYMDVHGPYQAKSGNTYLNKYRGEQLWRKASRRPDDVTAAEHNRLRELYNQEVQYVDDCLDDLFGALSKRNLMDETSVVVTADHGEQFSEHGKYSHPHELYEELINVPLIISGPDVPARHQTDIEELISVAPTMIDLAGGNPPDSFLGQSVFNDEGTDAVVSEANLYPNYTGCVRTDCWKYIRDQSRGRELLFDLAEDPDEQKNKIDANPDQGAKLREQLDEYLSIDNRRQRENEKRTDVDAETRDRLEKLGYLD